MKQALKLFLFWAPRVACLLFAAFLGMFAWDAFGEGHGFWKMALALVMHLLPAALVLTALAIAWRWERLGALLFFGLGSWYALANLSHPTWILGIAGPAFLISGLFLLNDLCLKSTRTHTTGLEPSSRA